MESRITTNAAELTSSLRAVHRQLPFATALALTAIARSAQKAMQDRMPVVFKLRGTEALFRRAVKMKAATKRDLVANVRIEGPETAKGYDGRISRMILRHETGGRRTAQTLYRVHGAMQALGFYLPTGDLQSDSRHRPKALYPVNLGITVRREASGREYFASSRKGKKLKRGRANLQRERSYFATPTGIYERVNTVAGLTRSSGRGGMRRLRLLWFFSRSIRLRPRLGFHTTMQRVWDREAGRHLSEGWARALATAR